jgi:hypothetical protein
MACMGARASVTLAGSMGVLGKGNVPTRVRSGALYGELSGVVMGIGVKRVGWRSMDPASCTFTTSNLGRVILSTGSIQTTSSPSALDVIVQYMRKGVMPMSRAPLVQDPDFTLYLGDSLEVLRELPAESVDMVCTSPPYW